MWIPEQWDNTLSVQIFFWGQSGEIYERGIDVDEADRPVAATTWFSSAASNSHEPVIPRLFKGIGLYSLSTLV